MMKTIFKVLALFMIALIIGTVFYLKTPKTSQYNIKKAQDVAAQYDAHIIRDQWGVPHIYGARDRDVAFGFAYAHAEDDWATLQDTLAFSRGTFARYTGRKNAITDYLVDLFKVHQTIEMHYENDVSEEMKAVFDAYAAGATLYATEHPEKAYPDFLPITAKDILAGFVFRTPFFYGIDNDLQKLMEAETTEPVAGWRAASFLFKNIPDPVIGSNGFAVAPNRSDDGHTRLVVNSHQPFTGPVAWYEARLKSEEGLDIIGATFPGSPLITVGTTPNLGWVHTVNKPDLADIFKLDTDNDKNPKRYKMDDEWHDLEITKSRFRIRLNDNFSLPVTRKIYWSAHGPVMETPNGFYAIRYAGMDNLKAADQWYSMGRAQNWEQWWEAYNLRGLPSFSTVYADKDGNIGYIYNGLMPKRQAGYDWRNILPGDQSNLIWNEYHSRDEMPHAINPKSGWLFSANHTPFDVTDKGHSPKKENFPTYFGIETHYTNRSLRALELITADTKISLEELLRYRSDNQYSNESNLRAFINAIDNAKYKDAPELQEAVKLMKSWDGNTGIDNRAAALSIITGVKMMGSLLNNKTPLERDALQSSVDQLNKHFGRIDPEWGKVNRLIRGDVSLPLDGGPDTLRAIYGNIDAFNDKGILEAVAGDGYILYSDWDKQGIQTVASIHQFGTATLDQSSPHYADQTALFASGGYKEMAMSLDNLLKQSTRDYRVGGRAQK